MIEFLKNHNFANFNEIIIQATVINVYKTVKSGFSTTGHSLWDTFDNIWRLFLLFHIPIRWCVRAKSVESTSCLVQLLSRSYSCDTP